MSWLWKDKPQEKTSIEITTNHNRGNMMRKNIKVHLDINMEFPIDMDPIQAIRSVKANFDLPKNIDILTADISHVEILGDSDV